MLQLKHQQRHEASDYFLDSFRCSTIWVFLYETLQINYWAPFVGWNVVRRQLVHPTSCLASRHVVKAMVDTDLNIFLCVYSLALPENCSNVFIRKKLFLEFRFWLRTLLICFSSSRSSCSLKFSANVCLTQIMSRDNRLYEGYFLSCQYFQLILL